MQAKVTGKHTKVAVALLDGKAPAEACRDAGYSPVTVDKKSYQIVGSEQVRAELRRLGAGVQVEELDEISRARLVDVLADPETDFRSLVVAIRLAQEIAGKVGAGRAQEHLHRHELNFSPETRALLAHEVAEILERKRLQAEAEPCTPLLSPSSSSPPS